jgi:hypothetical protein
MPRFEVFCPAAPPAVPVDVTLRVEAEHWLAALKAGLQKVGGAQVTSNVLCDIQADGSIHVTDPGGGGVFRITELRAEAPPVPAAAVRAPPPPAARPSAQPDRVAQVERPSAPPPARIGRAPAPTAEDVLTQLFERVGDLSRHRDRKSGLGFLLDLAIETVEADAGSVFLCRPGTGALAFEVVRGPRASQLVALGELVPMGVGIVGFCAQEDVCLAVSDAEKDPRFHRAISEAIGYETRSLLCAPIARKGRVLGALEVLNKRGGVPFGATDLAALAYLAHQAAELLVRLG